MERSFFILEFKYECRVIFFGYVLEKLIKASYAGIAFRGGNPFIYFSSLCIYIGFFP